MKKMINTTHIEGLVYDHKLEKKISGEGSKNPGTEFINGILNIATDDACLNVIPVHFSYVTAVTSKGGTNNTYNALSRIIDGAPCIAKDGKDKALKVRIDSSVGLNEFFADLKDEKPVCAKRNEGGFVHIVDNIDEDEKKRSYFETDMLITGVRDVDADPDRNLPAKVVIMGYTFDFRNALLPVEYSVLNENGMKYFQKLDCSPKNPVFTKVWGRQISQTVRTEITEESAFGEASVRIRETTNRDFVITGTSKVPYMWDDETTITAMEMTKALQDREIYLAGVKKRQEEYQNSKNSKSTAAIASTAASGYNF